MSEEEIYDRFETLEAREKAAKARYALQCERLQKLQAAALAALHAEQDEITDAKRPLFDELRRIEGLPTPLDNLSEKSSTAQALSSRHFQNHLRMSNNTPQKGRPRGRPALPPEERHDRVRACITVPRDVCKKLPPKTLMAAIVAMREAALDALENFVNTNSNNNKPK